MVSSTEDAGPGAGSSSADISRRRRETSARLASRNLRQATVVSQPFASRGGPAGQPRNASMSASCKASSAAAKSAPRRTRTPITLGARLLIRASFTSDGTEVTP